MPTTVDQTGGVGAGHLLLLLFGVGLCLFQPAAAASVPETPTISCSVTCEDGDVFRYQLSRPPTPSTCVSGWEDENKTAIVQNKEFDKNLVQTLTSQSIITRSCRDYLHYTENFDCKSLLEQQASPRPSVTSPPETWCQDWLKCGLSIGFGIGGPAVLGLIIWCIWSKWSKCRKRRSLAAMLDSAGCRRSELLCSRLRKRGEGAWRPSAGTVLSVGGVKRGRRSSRITEKGGVRSAHLLPTIHMMALSCLRATSPAAVNPSLVFHHNNDDVNLWERANLSVPLPACSSPDAPDSRCHVCMGDNQVYAFCRNLLDRAGLVMEGTDPGSAISLEEITCPVFPSGSPQNLHSSTGSPLSIGLVIVIVMVIVFLLVVGFVIYHRYCKKKHEGLPSGEGNAAGMNMPEEEPDRTTEAHTVL
ncbi:hypothetical protein INR49_007169 [Caranx melampygus]|nr:hypothetical protein INR49_007169 [Caranx melampygus]